MKIITSEVWEGSGNPKGTMVLFVKTLTGKAITIRAHPNETISEIKTYIKDAVLHCFLCAL